MPWWSARNLCRKLSLQAGSDAAVPEQQIAGIVSRYFSALSERSETVAWHRVLEGWSGN
ncbi:Uncharacterised protein [Serratia liquefaciens]|nr:Uncharacterised protein [Serratia liquefaciens]